MNTRYNYDTLKTLATKLGRRVSDLLALAPQNDPFYVGTPTDHEQAEWFAALWHKAGYTSGVHLRRVHYFAVSQPALLMHNGQPYQNTDKCWDYLVMASKKARYLGLVGIAEIIDNKNPTPRINARYDWLQDEPGYQLETPQLAQPSVYISGIDDVLAQPYHLEIWCEKSTMNDVLIPIAQRYNANLVTFEGEVSITACFEFMRRVDASGGKPARLFYISDFDPAGNNMPVATSRKIQYMLEVYRRAYDVKVKPIVLTAAQIQEYRLPRTPIKESEARAGKFEAAFGAGAVELDALEALHPGALARIVLSAISPYYSQDAAEEVHQKQQALQFAINTQVEAITARYQAEIEALQGMIEELAEISIDPTPYAVNQYEPHVEEDDDDWLFASERDYLEQVERFKAHKGQ